MQSPLPGCSLIVWVNQCGFSLICVVCISDIMYTLTACGGIFALLGSYTMQIGSWLPGFRDELSGLIFKG